MDEKLACRTFHLLVCINYPQHSFLLTQIAATLPLTPHPPKQDFLPWFMNYLRESLEILFLFNFKYLIFTCVLYLRTFHASIVYILTLS